MVSGRTCFGTRVRIVDEEERDLPQDGEHVGHLRVKAPGSPAAISNAPTASTRKAI